MSTLANDGPGSLREAAMATGPAWIRFSVSGIIDLRTSISIASDKTIDGRGADITITSDGLFVENGAGNVIINNIRMRDSEDDLIRFYAGGTQMWVHHCDLENGGDGAFDATEGTSAVTISYTHIKNHDKTMLIGSSSDTGDGSSMRFTAHHNWYEDCVQRLPFIRFGQAHSYNNLMEWRSGTAMSVRLSPAQMLVENNILKPLSAVGHKVNHVNDGAVIRFVGNLDRPLAGDEIEIIEFMPEQVFDPHESYDYSADLANDDLIQQLQANTGWQDIPFPE